MDKQILQELTGITDKLTEEIKGRIKKEVERITAFTAKSTVDTPAELLDKTLSKLITEAQKDVTIEEIYSLLCRYKAIYEVFLSEKIKLSIQTSKLGKTIDETSDIQQTPKTV